MRITYRGKKAGEILTEETTKVWINSHPEDIWYKVRLLFKGEDGAVCMFNTYFLPHKAERLLDQLRERGYLDLRDVSIRRLNGDPYDY